MADADLSITFLNGDTITVQRDSTSQVRQICRELERVLQVQGPMEINLISGSTLLTDPLPDKMEDRIQGVISPSPIKALAAIQLYMDTRHQAVEAASPRTRSPPRSEDAWESASESSSDYGYMALIHPFIRSDQNTSWGTPAKPLAPEEEACNIALRIIEEDFEVLPDLQEATCRLLDLSELQGYRLDKLPKSLELAVKGIQILVANINHLETAVHVKAYLRNGFYDVVRIACTSTRTHADTWLSEMAELMAASHCSTPSVRLSLCKIISTCPAPATRMTAVKSLAKLAFTKHERDIANVGKMDTNEEVRRVSHAIHKEGMENWSALLEEQC